MELRPLGFGEIFDRAVTLYVRNFVPFAAIVGALIVPIAVVQYFYDVDSQPQLDAAVRVLMHPQAARTVPLPFEFGSPSAVIALVALLLATYALWPFALNAVAVGVALVYRNATVGFRACYEIVLARWSQIIAMLFIELGVFVACYIACFVAAMPFAFMIAGIAAFAPRFGLFVGVVFMTAGFFALVVGAAALGVALSFAMYATVIEERPPFESLTIAFDRIFNRREFWRAVLFSLAAAAIVLAGSAMFGFIGLIAAFLHLPLVQAAVESIVNAIITPFGAVLLAVYYFDVRIRHEGFDLETSLEHLTTPQPA